MKKESKAKKFPSFPPNKLFGYEEENFVKQRAKDLNKFFEEITNNQNYNNLPSFNNFIITNLKKNQVTPDPISTIEQKNVDIFSENKNYKNRALLFKFKFLKTEFQTQRALSQEEYDYILKEAEQKVEKLNKKFVNINYDINISPKIKLEPKYNNICNNINNNSNENICIKSSSDDNFNFIGRKDKNSDNIINIEKNMKIYLNLYYSMIQYLIILNMVIPILKIKISKNMQNYLKLMIYYMKLISIIYQEDKNKELP